MVIPDYYLIFEGMITEAVTIAIPDEKISDKIISGLESLFSGIISPEDLNFTHNHYLPEMRELMSKKNINIIERAKVCLKLVGTGIKLLYAFIF